MSRRYLLLPVSLRGMPRRNLDLAKTRAPLSVVCSHCSAIIEPENQVRVDAEEMDCPWCGETFVPKRQIGVGQLRGGQ